jgi:hypothetical protein
MGEEPQILRITAGQNTGSVCRTEIETAAGAPRRGQPKAVEKIFIRKSWTAAALIITGGMGASAPINIRHSVLFLFTNQ